MLVHFVLLPRLVFHSVWPSDQSHVLLYNMFCSESDAREAFYYSEHFSLFPVYIIIISWRCLVKTEWSKTQQQKNPQNNVIYMCTYRCYAIMFLSWSMLVLVGGFCCCFFIVKNGRSFMTVTSVSAMHFWKSCRWFHSLLQWLLYTDICILLSNYE